MNKLKWSRVAIIAGLLIGVVIWWITSEDQKDELDKSDAFVYSDEEFKQKVQK